MLHHTAIAVITSASVTVLLSVITHFPPDSARVMSITPGSTISALVVRSSAAAWICRMISAS